MNQTLKEYYQRVREIEASLPPGEWLLSAKLGSLFPNQGRIIVPRYVAAKWLVDENERKKKRKIMTNQQAVISVSDIYGTENPNIDLGYLSRALFVIPQENETFLSPKGEVCTLQPGDVRPAGPRLLLREKNVHDVYGTWEPDIPEGFESTGEFRKGEQGDWVLGATDYLSTGNASLFKDLGEFRDNVEPRLILRKVFTPTPEDVYGTIPASPKGYHLGKFEKCVGNKTYLGVGGGTFTKSLYTENFWRYDLLPLPKFKIGDMVLVNGHVPALVTDIKENPGSNMFDTKVVFDKSDGSSGWQASKYMKLDPTPQNRWLLEVESDVEPTNISIYADRGNNPDRCTPVLSVTRKS